MGVHRVGMCPMREDAMGPLWSRVILARGVAMQVVIYWEVDDLVSLVLVLGNFLSRMELT